MIPDMISAGWKWIERGAAHLWPVSLELIVAATLLLLIAAVMHLGLRRAAASLRHRVWALTMGGLLLLPFLCPILPKLPLPLSIPLAESRPVASKLAASEPATSTPATSTPAPVDLRAVALPPAKNWTDSDVHPTSSVPAADVPATPAIAPPAAPVADAPLDRSHSLLAKIHCALILVWALGTVLYLLAMARWLWLERRLARSDRAPDDPSLGALAEEIKQQLGIRWAVAVGASQEAEVPLTIGWRRPTILLPVDCGSWTADKRRVVLAHELSHVARHDVFWQVAARLACAVYWFHPLAWLAERRLRVERELACDDAVLRFGSQPGQYAAVLLDVAARVGRRPCAGAAVIAMACRHPIQRRIRAILQPGLNRLPVGPRTGKLLLASAVLLVVLAAGLHPFAPPVKAENPKSEADTAKPAADAAKSPESTHLAPGDVAAKVKSDKPGVRSIRFRVVNQAGKPVAGAKVKPWPEFKETVADFHPPAGETDREGVTTVEFPQQKNSYGMAVSAADYVTAGARWGNQPPAEFVITLEPGTTMGGTVRDEQDRPIAGVEVVISSGEKLPDGIHFNEVDDTVRTDAQGRWTSHRMPKDFGRYVFAIIGLKHPAYASPPGFDLKSQPLDQLRAGAAVMVMHKGTVVEGVVYSPQGKPVAGATVGQINELSGGGPLRTKTDKNGHYRLPPCEAGDYTIAAVAKGCAPDFQRVTVANSPLTVGLQLRKGELVRVRVVDKQGKPLRGATVSTVFDGKNLHVMMLDDETVNSHEPFLTDAEGRWRKLWIPDDPVHLIVSKPGYAQADIKVATGEPERVVALQSGGWKLSGRVVDRDTKAAITKFYLVEGDVMWRQRTAVENAAGEFRKEWDTSGHVVRIEADGHLPSKRLTLDPGQREATFNLELEKGKEIAGVVRDPDGKPVAGADVALASATRLVYLQNSRPLDGQDTLLARTGADGRFMFAPQGERYILIALHDRGFARIEGDVDDDNEIALQPWARVEGTVYVDGRPAAREHVRLDFADDGMEIARNEHRPIGINPGRFLYYDYQAQADDKGHFLMDRVRPGKGKISRYIMVSHEGMTSSWKYADTREIDVEAGKTLTVNLGAPTVEFKPPADAPSGKTGGEADQGESHPRGANTAPTKVSGKVIDERGRAVDAADVWLRVLGHVQYAKADSKGLFSLEVPSAWLAELQALERLSIPQRLWAYAAGYQLGLGNLVLSSSVSNLTIRLGPATNTSFVVSDPEGRPCAGALVEPENIRTLSWLNEPVPDELLARVGARTDREGRANLPAAPPDRLYSVRVHAKGFGTQLQPTTPESAIVGSPIRLRPVGKIEGRVVGGPPELVRGIRLVFHSEEKPNGPRPFPLKVWPIEGLADIKTDEQGRFTVAAIAAGDAWIEARVDEKQPLRLKLPKSVSVHAGQTTSLEIPLVPSVVVRGTVRVKDTGKPVPGANVHIYYGVGRQGADPVSDARGNYTARVLPGGVGVQVIYMPEPYVQVVEGDARQASFRPLEVPKDAKEFNLPPIEVEVVPMKSIRGRVVDRQSHPIGNIEISVRVGGRQYSSGKSDKEGRFEMSVPATMKPGNVEYGWFPEVGPGRPFVSTVPSKCEIIKADPLLLRALPRDPLADSP